MGFRMRKSIKIAPGVRMNISAKSIGVSAGVRGARVSASSSGRRTTSVGIPGTGLSYVSSSSRGSRPAKPAPRKVTRPPAPSRPASHKPGMFSPAWEKALFKRMVSQKGPTYEELAEKYPEALNTISMVEAMFVAFPANDEYRLKVILNGLHEAGYEPSNDTFLRAYTHDGKITLTVAEGVSAQMPISRSAIALQLAELEQARSERSRAIEIVESIEPTTMAAVSLAELYAAVGRWDDVVDLTNGVTNEDEPSTYLLMQRARALREQGYFEAAREASKEALRIRSRPAELRNLAYVERGQAYLAENKTAMARKDFERVLATDDDFPGIRELIAAAGGVAVAAADVPVDGANDEIMQKESFDVILHVAGHKKIHVIKVVREFTSLSLAEAKAVVESTPQTVLVDAARDTAEKAKAALEKVGASVTLVTTSPVAGFRQH